MSEDFNESTKSGLQGSEPHAEVDFTIASVYKALDAEKQELLNTPLKNFETLLDKFYQNRSALIKKGITSAINRGEEECTIGFSGIPLSEEYRYKSKYNRYPVSPYTSNTHYEKMIAEYHPRQIDNAILSLIFSGLGEYNYGSITSENIPPESIQKFGEEFLKKKIYGLKYVKFKKSHAHHNNKITGFQLKLGW